MATSKSKKRKGRIKNNPRLNLRSKQNDDDDDAKLIKPVDDYEFLIECLSSPNMALRPQMILEFIAITIQKYVGTYITVNMHSKSFVINHSTGIKYLLKSLQINDPKQIVKSLNTSSNLLLPININQLHDVTRIALIVPVIYYNTMNIAIGNNHNIAILRERKIRKGTRSSTNDFQNHIIYPHILDNIKYEWNIFNNLYITGIQKNYNWTQNIIQNELNYQKRSHLERTILSKYYAITGHIVKCIILYNTTYNIKLCLFSTTSGLFYTDYRLIHKYNIQQFNFNINISLPLLYRNIWSQTNVFVDLWTQSMNDVYCWNDGDNKLYTITFKSFDDNSNNYNIDLNDINDVGVDNKDNDNKQEFGDKMNNKLKSYNLLNVIPLFKIDKKKHIYSLQTPDIRSCEIKCVYYQNDIETDYVSAVYWIEMTSFYGWIYGAIARNNVFKHSKNIKNKLYAKETQFYLKHKGIQKEEFYIAFVDERDIKNKKFIIILKKHVIIIPLLQKNDINNYSDNKVFGKCYSVKDIVPKILLNNTTNNEIKLIQSSWHYNYSNQTLYIFEKMSASGSYPYRMRELAINAFKF